MEWKQKDNTLLWIKEYSTHKRIESTHSIPLRLDYSCIYKHFFFFFSFVELASTLEYLRNNLTCGSWLSKRRRRPGKKKWTLRINNIYEMLCCVVGWQKTDTGQHTTRRKRRREQRVQESSSSIAPLPVVILIFVFLLPVGSMSSHQRRSTTKGRRRVDDDASTTDKREGGGAATV